MVDEFIAIVVLTALGAFGGFLSSWMAFNASGEAFSGRKHGNALIIGVISGLAVGAGVSVAGAKDMTPAIFFVLAITTFGTAVGIDRLRSSGSQMIANSTEKKTVTSSSNSNPT